MIQESHPFMEAIKGYFSPYAYKVYYNAYSSPCVCNYGKLWCFDIIGYPPGYNKNYSKSGVKSNFNANAELNQPSTQNGPTLSFTNDQMMKLMSLINEIPSGNIQANMAANQHMTITTKNMFEVTDISDLNLTVRHPNGTMAKIKYVGNLQLSKDVVLYDVLVVSEYCVSL
ncbi:hypothetical protein Tco_0195885 [Tanacetum coccineum]